MICGAAICTASCSGDGFGSGDKISIVTTIFPAYDWTREILGDNADNFSLTMLLDNSVDLHSYQPTADDMAKIAGCDMFICVGGDSNKWVEDTLSTVGNKNMITVNMLDVLGDGVLKEEILDGMEHEHENEDEEHEHEDDEQKAEIRNEYIDQMTRSQEVTDKITAAVASVNSATASIAQLKGQLDNYSLFYDGLKEYTSAVSNAADGANILKINMETLYENVGVLQASVGELCDGVKELFDGTTALKDGTSEFVKETDGIGDEVREEIDNMISKARRRMTRYRSMPKLHRVNIG